MKFGIGTNGEATLVGFTGKYLQEGGYDTSLLTIPGKVSVFDVTEIDIEEWPALFDTIELPSTLRKITCPGGTAGSIISHVANPTADLGMLQLADDADFSDHLAHVFVKVPEGTAAQYEDLWGGDCLVFYESVKYDKKGLKYYVDEGKRYATLAGADGQLETGPGTILRLTGNITMTDNTIYTLRNVDTEDLDVEMLILQNGGHHLHIGGNGLKTLVIPGHWDTCAICTSLERLVITDQIGYTDLNPYEHINTVYVYGDNPNLSQELYDNTDSFVGNSAFCSSHPDCYPNPLPEKMADISYWTGGGLIFNGYYVTGYNNLIGEKVEVPENNGNYTIKGIAEGALEGCTKIKSLSLPSGLETIGKNAFKDCSNLQTVQFAVTPKEIGESAFENCSSLKTLDLRPDQAEYLTQIKLYAFENCTSLESVILPYRAMMFSAYAFRFCRNLSYIDFPMTVLQYDSNLGVFAGIDSENLVIMSKYATPPCALSTAGLETNFDTEAFGNAKIYIPWGTKETYKSSWKAFDETCFIEDEDPRPTIAVNGIQYIIDTDGGYAFVSGFKENVVATTPGEDDGDDVLTYDVRDELTLESSLTWEDTTYPVTTINDEALKDCHILRKVTIPSSYTKIGNNAFTGSTLEEIVLDCPLDGMFWHSGTSPFYLCEHLTKATLTTNCGTTLPIGIFSNATSLKELNLPEGLETIGVNSLCYTAIEEVDLPSSLKEIGDDAFEGSQLKSIELPEGITTLGYSPFSGTQLEYLYIPRGVTSTSDVSKICSGLSATLKKLEFASDCPIEGIPYGCCQDFEKLEEVILPNAIKSIGEWSFSRCSALKKIDLPETLETVGEYAFYNSSGLHLRLPESLKSVGKQAFTGVYLEPFTLSSELEDIASRAFWGANWNTQGIVSFLDTPFDRGDDGRLVNYKIMNLYYKYSDSQMPTLWVPSGSKTDYEEAWGDEFKDIREHSGKDYDVSIGDKSSPRGATLRLPVNMSNISDVTGLMFDMTLPEGTSVVKNSAGNYYVQLGDAVSGHNLYVSELANGDYRFIIISFSSESFAGINEQLLTLDIDVSTDIAPGSYSVDIHNVSLVSPDGSNIESYCNPGSASTLEITSKLMGDVNGNSRVDLADAVCIINHFNGRTPGTFDPELADLNSDGSVTLADVIKIINVLKYASSAPAAPTSGEIWAERTQGGFDICVSTANDYTALSIDLALPEGTELKGVTTETTRCADHQAVTSRLDDGATRIILFSPTGTPIGNDGCILHVKTDMTPTAPGIKNVELVTTDARTFSAEAIPGYTTGMSRIKGGLSVRTEGRGIVVSTATACNLTVCDTQGRTLRSLRLTPGSHTISGLAPGVYLINDTKYVIK